MIRLFTRFSDATAHHPQYDILYPIEGCTNHYCARHSWILIEEEADLQLNDQSTFYFDCPYCGTQDGVALEHVERESVIVMKRAAARSKARRAAAKRGVA